MDGVIITPLKRISHEKGDILHFIKNSDSAFKGFGEVYFSFVRHCETKGWKKHTLMTMNLVVPVGHIRFLIKNSAGERHQVVLGETHYCRLTLHPGLWLAFQGIDEGANLLANFADIAHDPSEAINVPWEEL